MAGTLRPRQGCPHSRPQPSISISLISSRDGDTDLSSSWIVMYLGSR